MTNHHLKYNAHRPQSEELGLQSQRGQRWKLSFTIPPLSLRKLSDLLKPPFDFSLIKVNSNTLQLGGLGQLKESRR